MVKKTILKRFGDLEPGDVVKDANGEVTVLEAYDEHIPETMYEIETDSGASVKASGNHLWYIETSLDINLHSERRRTGAKLFKKLPKKVIDELLEIAEYSGEEELETALIDMIALLDVEDNKEAVASLIRIAESIGPISENNIKMRDLYVNEDTIVNTVRNYDAKRFAQQILSLTGNKKFRKQWSLVVGRVVTTERMLELSENFEVYIPDTHNNIV